MTEYANDDLCIIHAYLCATEACISQGVLRMGHSYVRTIYFVSAKVQTQSTLRPGWINEAAPKSRVAGPFLCLICSAIIEHEQKPDERQDSTALLTLYDWYHLLEA